jgi:hypothetical protein
VSEEATIETTEVAEEQAEQTIPYGRFKEVNERLKAAEAAAQSAAEELKKREEAELSEKERAEKQAAEAVARAEAAEARATTLERSSWVRDAASSFNDPADAVAMLDLSEIDSADKAKAAVEELGKSKPHLVKSEQPQKISSPLAPAQTAQVPTGADGKPDHKAGLGAELMNNLIGRG